MSDTLRTTNVIATKIGIGTATPQYALDIVGSINYTGSLMANGSNFTGSQWTTSGSNVYYTTGSVGVGTNNPANILQIYGSSSNWASGVAAITNTHTAPVTSLTVLAPNMVTTSSIAFLMGQSATTQNAFVLQFNYNASGSNTNTFGIGAYGIGNQLVITGAGNVGIATITPTAMLDVLGSFRVLNQTYTALTSGTGVDIIYSSGGTLSSGTRGAGGLLTAATMSYAASTHTFYTGTNAGTSAVTIASSGAVGIGTAAISGQLHVYGTSTPTLVIGGASAANNQVQITYTQVASGSSANYGSLQMNNIGSILNWTAAGKVGIGLTNPAYAMDVSGSVNVTGSFYVNGVAFSGSSQWTTSGSNIYYTTGSVGIGTNNPGAKFNVVGGSMLVDWGRGYGIHQTYPDMGSYSIHGVSGGTAMRIALNSDPATHRLLQIGYYTGDVISGAWNQTMCVDPISGSVGIGTNSPAEKLHVNGNVITNLSYAQTCSYTLTSASNTSKWYKLASFTGTTYGEFLLAWDVSGEHGEIKFTVACSYNSEARLNITSTTFYNQAILQLRIATDPASIYNTNYVEFYTNSSFYASVVLNCYLLTVSPVSGGLTLLSTLTAGTTTFNYSSTPTYLAQSILTGGSPYVVTPSGQVGIGTTNPSGMLHIHNPNQWPYGMILSNASNISQQLVIGTYWTGTAGTSYSALQSVTQNVANNNLILNPYAGNVGIGLTNPSSLLHVNGAVNCTNLLVNGVAVATGTGSVWTAGSGGLISYTGGTVNVMKGTYAPPSVGLNGGTGDRFILWTGDTSVYPYSIGIDASTLWFSSPGNQKWYNNGSMNMILNSYGQLGIGTATPSYSLDVVGTAQASTAFQSSISTVMSGIGTMQAVYLGQNGASAPRGTCVRIGDIAGAGYYLSTGNCNLSFYKDVSSANPALAFQIVGTTQANATPNIYVANNLGVGTTNPGAKLSVIPPDGSSNYALLSFINSSGYGIYVNSTAIASHGNTMDWYAYDYNFGTITTRSMMTMRPEGQIGIGTTTPAAPLHIVGSTANYGSNGTVQITNTNSNPSGCLTITSPNMTAGTVNEISFGLSATSYNMAWIAFNYVGAGSASNYTEYSHWGTGNHPLVITAGGSVGIGITNPGQLLHVSGDGARVRIETLTANNSVLELKTNANISYLFTDQSGHLQIYPYTTAKYILMQPSGGSVGIGTYTPNYPLTISNGNASSIEFNRTGASDNYGAGITHSLTSSTGSFRAEYVKVYGGSNGTIATTAQSQANGYYCIDLANAGNFAASVTPSNAAFFMTNTQALFNVPLRTTGQMTVGGIDRTQCLVIKNTSTANGALGQSGIMFDGTAVTNGHKYCLWTTTTGENNPVGGLSLYDDTAQAYRLTISSGGNMGIGTYSPSYPLDVFTGTQRIMQAQSAGVQTVHLGPLADNTYDLGWTGSRWRNVWSANGTVQTSDSSVKDAKPLSYGLAEVLQMRTIQYKWKYQADLPDDAPEKNYEYYGFCADELAPVFPELVYDEKKDQPVQMNYSEIMPVLVNAIKELTQQVTELKGRLAAAGIA